MNWNLSESILAQCGSVQEEAVAEAAPFPSFLYGRGDSLGSAVVVSCLEEAQGSVATLTQATTELR